MEYFVSYLFFTILTRLAYVQIVVGLILSIYLVIISLLYIGEILNSEDEDISEIIEYFYVKLKIKLVIKITSIIFLVLILIPSQKQIIKIYLTGYTFKHKKEFIVDFKKFQNKLDDKAKEYIKLIKQNKNLDKVAK